MHRLLSVRHSQTIRLLSNLAQNLQFCYFIRDKLASFASPTILWSCGGYCTSELCAWPKVTAMLGTWAVRCRVGYCWHVTLRSGGTPQVPSKFHAHHCQYIVALIQQVYCVHLDLLIDAVVTRPPQHVKWPGQPHCKSACRKRQPRFVTHSGAL